MSCGDSIQAPTKVLIWDPCPFGQPTVAHMTGHRAEGAGAAAEGRLQRAEGPGS